MAPARRSTRLRDLFRKQQHKNDDSFRDGRRRRRNILHDRGVSSANVNALVYKYLGNLEDVVRSHNNNFSDTLRRSRKNTKLNNSPRSNSSSCITVSASGAGSQSYMTDVQSNIQSDMESSRSIASTSCASEPASESRVAKTMMDKLSILQVFNRYIRAGLEEGKRKAKSYVAKALSFALDSGYLIPAGNSGKLLRISRTLTGFKPINVQATVNRIRRRNMRKNNSLEYRYDRCSPSLDDSSVASKRTEDEKEPDTDLDESNEKNKANKTKNKNSKTTEKKRVKFPPATRKRRRKLKAGPKNQKRHADATVKRNLRNRSKTPGRVLETRQVDNSDTRPNSMKSNRSGQGNDNGPERTNLPSSHLSSRGRNTENRSRSVENIGPRDNDETNIDRNEC